MNRIPAICIFGLLTWSTWIVIAQDLEKLTTISSFSHFHSNDSGICPGALLSDQTGPVAWFGLNKRPDEKTQYTYLILFPRGKNGSAAISGFKNRSDVSNYKATADMQLMWKKQELKVLYNFEVDRKTGEILKNELSVNGEPVDRYGSRVFVVVTEHRKLEMRSVDVELPSSVPDVTDDSNKWPDAIKTAIKLLREESSEINGFLGKIN